MTQDNGGRAFPQKAGLPTATKDNGAEWYWPAVTQEFGRPSRLLEGARQETRAKAKTMARKILAARKGES